MKIVLLEFITGGGLAEKALPAELAREGERMVTALMHDLNEIPGIRLKVLRDARLPPLARSNRTQLAMEILTVDSKGNYTELWRHALAWADAAWIVAPETDGILEGLSTQVIEQGRLLLGSQSQAVHLCGDKFETHRHLSLANVATVPTVAGSDFEGQFAPPWVVKPRNQVGCEGIRRIDTPETDLSPFLNPAWIFQPYIDGLPLSLSAVFSEGESLFISGNRQQLRWDGGRAILEGCWVNCFQDPDGRWQNLCAKIARVLPGLWGYVGIDLIVNQDQCLIVEINPRLTLSYAGLRDALGINLAEWLVGLADRQVDLDQLVKKRCEIIGREVEVRP